MSALSTSPTRSRRRCPGPLGAVTAVLLLLLGATACGGTADGSAEPDAPSSKDGSAASLGVAHVHGLEVDPDDADRVYVATHDGLFAFTEGAGLDRVGKTRSDLMGFTVGPADTLFASGHSAPGSGGPADLGLITSTDAGASWAPVALSGEADFHAMDAGESGVVGYDASNGVLRVSEDGRTFATVAGAPGFIDLAVDTTSQDVWGTTDRGQLVRSGDGGRSFAEVPDAPQLVLIDVAPDGTVVGIGMDGRLHTTTGAGEWTVRDGAADRGLQAFTAGPDGAVWLLDSRGLVRSDDLGDTFTDAEGW
ncbi:hypothetical protein KLP28_13595 [Nocardioidaceae bacterium]|nr:hypothetical protein KLP28_13595 [Nocardioidaceae bacterium]